MTDLPTQVWVLFFLGTPYLIAIVAVLIVQTVRWLRRLWATRKAPNDVTEPRQPSDAVASVFLLHGTFARGAAWTQPGSPLRDAVMRGIGGPVAFHTILWSGRNSVAARRAASDDLHRRVTRSLKRHPDRRHLVIAHSHGGNIAMQALSRDFELGARCQLICLSTPFLVLRPRPALPILEFCSLLAPFFLSVFALRALNLWLGTPPQAWWAVASLIGAVALSVVVAMAASRAGRRIADDLMDETQVPRMPSKNVLLLRMIADEASMGIAAANLISRATQMVLQVPLGMLAAADQRVEQTRVSLEPHRWVFLWSGILLFAAIFVISLMGKVDPSDTSVAVRLLLLAGAVILFLVYGFASRAEVLVTVPAVFAMSLLLFPVLALLSLLAITTGREMALANAHLEFFAEPAPIGDWNLVIVHEHDTRSDPLKAAKRPTLQHSQSYLNSSALYTVERWIADHNAPKRSSGADQRRAEFGQPSA
ncbi:esterase/lipase family protein [Roseobacter sinensis]|nr:lysophospholipase [Roseobacter sp. WL0113]